MRSKRLQRRTETIAAALGIDLPCDARVFCRSLAAHRRRPIIIIPWELPAGVSGMWCALPTVDLIYHMWSASGMHQQQIIAHEGGHIALGHKPAHTAVDDLSPTMVQFVMQERSTAYSTKEDREAELFGTFLLTRSFAALPIVQPARTPAAAPDPAVRALMRRLATSLGGTSTHTVWPGLLADKRATP